MAVPTLRHDVVGGAAVTMWIAGMGLVLGVEDAAWHLYGACLWGIGLIAAGTAATHAYLTRCRDLDGQP